MFFENSTIWMNGEETGGQKYGYSSFRVDVTSFIKNGDNLLLIKVDNTVHPVDRWYSGCGIYRIRVNNNGKGDAVLANAAGMQSAKIRL